MNKTKQFLLESGTVLENEYLDKYVNLIELNRHRNYERYKTNKHHIIPKSYFKKNKLDVDNSELNVVNLLYKDHALAHYYFALCTSYKYLKWDSEYALRYILNNKNFKCSESYEQERSFIESLDEFQSLYEELKHHVGDIHRGKTISEEHRKRLSEALSGRKLSDSTRSKMSQARMGVHLSESTKKKLSDINMGKKLSDETKLKISLNAKINDNYGMKNKIMSEDSKKKISIRAKEQWSNEKNREEQSHRQKSRKFHWYTDGIKNIQVNEGDEVPEGFYRGRHVSEEARKNMSLALMGHTPWNKGKHLSEEHKEHLRKKKIKRK